jgi:predicted MPP superfamily phosphohydrolase
MRFLSRAALAALSLGAYSLYEPYRYRLVTHRLEVPATVPEIKVLHLSDLHLKQRDRRLIGFVSGLSSIANIDLVLATGDLIEDNSGIEPLIDCFSTLNARWGCYYVLGSHDYHQSAFTSYAKYFTGRKGPLAAPAAATNVLESGLAKHGWKVLTNSRVTLATPAGKLKLAGIDDPYLGRHDASVIKRDSEDALTIGLVHSPDVVSEWFLAGFDLVLAGHTHAGQVRAPFYGALVTNCLLPAGLAGGPHRIGNGWLHVSPGLGTGKFSPIRFNCLPEATVLELVHR